VVGQEPGFVIEDLEHLVAEDDAKDVVGELDDDVGGDSDG